MKRAFFLVLLLSLSVPISRANMVITPWKAIFKGVDRAVGTNYPDAIFPRLQVANCVRVDLMDPDVQLFHTPRASNYVAESRETHSLTISNFLQRYGLQVACTANFYVSAQGYDPQSAGVACQVYGLAMSQGEIVSVPDFGPDSNNRRVSMLFTTNKTPFLVLSNGPPGTNTSGIYTAVTGYYPVLTNGVVLSDAVLQANYPDESIHNVHPRSIFGLSQDRRYLYMMIIDGRQPGYSEGALDSESGAWLLQFGGWDGVNMDGGGSTAMYMADCAGNPLTLGRSSYVAALGRERYTGSHLGVYAPPLPVFIRSVAATPGSVNAVITWQTIAPASSQVEYGSTTNYGSLSPLDSTPNTNHSVTLNGLSPLTRYYFRVISTAGTNVFAYSCSGAPFQTTNFAGGIIFPLTNTWRYSTANLDGINWKVPAYDDTAWPAGRAALWAHDGVNYGNTNNVPNLTTRMPVNSATSYPFPTYYFRTSFVFPDDPSNATLIFSNFLDDGAVFYLNGVEIRRVNLPAAPTIISNGTYTGATLCGGNATCPIVFNITGAVLSNLFVGTNVLAVEVHNAAAMSTDIVFQSALFYTLPPPPELPPFFSNIAVVPGETSAVITFDTLSNATAQILFGATPVLGAATELETEPLTNHIAVLTGLDPKTLYYYRIEALAGTNVQTFESTFISAQFYESILTFGSTWRFTTNKFAGNEWSSPGYDDEDWFAGGPALLYAEENVAVMPRNTPVSLGNNGFPYPTYYFRTRFTLTNIPAGMALVFTNYIDDAAVFYLNGAEIRRVRMPAGPIAYETYASVCPLNNCDATADVPDVFRLSANGMTNLLLGDNLLAVEVHQISATSSDVVFGSNVGFVRALAEETALRATRNGDAVCIEWDVPFLTLQQKATLGAGQWADVPGPVRFSPYCVTNPPASFFYRLRN
jgi:hypothetical protein